MTMTIIIARLRLTLRGLHPAHFASFGVVPSTLPPQNLRSAPRGHASPAAGYYDVGVRLLRIR